MRILIVGSGGQLGKELTKILSEGRSELGEIPKAFSSATVTGVDYQEINISDEEQVEEYFAKNSFELIVNCAAMTNVDACELDEGNAFLANAQGVKNLARAAQSMKAKFVQVSTDYVFSGSGDTPYIEKDPCYPETAYGRTKLAGEQFAVEECERSFIVRTAWLYGRSGNNFVKTISKLAKENGVIQVVDDQVGSPTCANDLADAILKLSLTEEYGVYHATNSGFASWYEFAVAIVDSMSIPCEKIPCTSDEFPRPAKRPAFSVLDCTKLEQAIGVELRSWHHALSSFLKNNNDWDK